MQPQCTTSNPAGLIALSLWMEQVGITPTTCWRWRKKGWLTTVNIAGRQYVSREAIEEFESRAKAGEFAQEPRVPTSPNA